MTEPKISPPVLVARIVKSHGIAGEVVLASLTDIEDRLKSQSVFLLTVAGEVQRELEVESRRFFSGRYVMKFRGVNTRDEADALRGKDLAIPEEQLGELPEEMFYIHELVGMRVRLVDGKEIGIVKNVMKTGGVDILEVGDQSEMLIPFADNICIDVDRENRQITVDPPEGLLELNAR